MNALLRATERWMEERFPVGAVKKFVSDQATKPLPAHTSWFHTFGSLAIFVIVNQIVTGMLLMIYYRPMPDSAFESVRFIMTKASFGWFIRGLHAWGSKFMIVLLLLHIVRTFFMGAYKKPRELTWVVGVCLFGIALTFGFTGYLLPWNQLSYWATTIGTEMAGALPLVGVQFKRLLLGGDAVGGETLSRFYVVHVIVFPWLLVGLTALHVVLMRAQGLATMDRVGEEKKPKGGLPFVPHHLLKEGVVFAIFLGFLITISILWPPELGEKANPFDTPQAIKPEWYWLPTYQLLKYFPKLLGVLICFLPPVVMMLWPFLDRTRERRFRKRPISVAIGILTIMAALVFGLLGHFSETDIALFGKKYHVDHYGVPRTPTETPHP
ncbi:MAG: cytochrome bc complex cytochrome b subunit [Planctomycetes bacterium]|nr:cytochrome bc complex cytochrome b subunit [Planctomycetota bacterium]